MVDATERSAVAWLIAALVLLALTGCGADTADNPSARPNVTSGRVVRVVDGDTAHVLIGGVREKVRFIGIDAPELSGDTEPFGQEATAHVRAAIEGRRVWIETDAELRDDYGRLLAYVWVERPESADEAEATAHLLNAGLVRDGFATAYTHPPNDRYAAVFRALEREARFAERGLWAYE